MLNKHPEVHTIRETSCRNHDGIQNKADRIVGFISGAINIYSSLFWMQSAHPRELRALLPGFLSCWSTAGHLPRKESLAAGTQLCTAWACKGFSEILVLARCYRRVTADPWIASASATAPLSFFHMSFTSCSFPKFFTQLKLWMFHRLQFKWAKNTIFKADFH